MQDTALTFEVTHYNEHGYKFTALRVRTMFVESVENKLAGTVNNAAGYGTADAARRVGEEMAALQARDVATVYESMLYGDVNFTIVYQHYGDDDDEYCEPRMELGGKIGQIERNVKFLKGLGRTIERRNARTRGHANPVSHRTFAAPDDVVSALARKRESVQIEQTGSRLVGTFVPTAVKVTVAA